MFFRLCTYWTHFSWIQPFDTFSDALREILELFQVRLLKIFQIKRVVQVTVDGCKPVDSILY